ncbi:MAG: hypothetical protein JSU87_02915 [Gemmatimonadota bacterium]|nr:MAG: hypothetical protein JSU87_02915 [Gemmatimonadota bacterium]
MNRWEKWCVWATSLAATISGGGLMWTKYFAESQDPWAVVNHPLQIWFLKLHILSSPLLVFALGLITTRHVWLNYRNRARGGRLTGLASVLLAAPMILTGYLVQLITNQGWLRAVAIAHIALGFAFALGLALHQAFARERRRLARGQGEGSERPGGKPAGRRETVGSVGALET